MHRIIKIIQSPRIFVFSLINMIVLVFLGTMFQGELGLYQTQKIYFSSWFYWLGFFPMLGGRTIIAIMFINLSGFLFRKNLWKIKKAGIIITHLGGLILILGSAITAYFSYEGQMSILEGEKSNIIKDYYLKELAIIVDDGTEISFDQANLNEGNILKSDVMEFEIKVMNFYDNCKIVKKQSICDECRGEFSKYDLIDIEPEVEYEMNHSAITYEISGISESVDGVYASTVYEVENNLIDIGTFNIKFVLRPERTYLPFSVHLIDFKEELHPGTDIAKSYSSDIKLIENNLSRDIRIQMNEPLRHKGYTFYQSSFNNLENKEISIFAVVKNYGRLFPYISSIIMCCGLLIHLFIKLFSSKKKSIKVKNA